MKKTLSLFLVIIIVLSLFSCTDNSNYNQAYEDDEFISNGYSNDNQSKKQESTKYYTISYNTNGGTYINQEKVKISEKIVALPSTERTGYLFDGWYLDNTFTSGAILPMVITGDTTFYAKWIKLTDTSYIENASIKLWDNSPSAVEGYITPSGFELDKLNSLGYYMTVTVTYNVRYTKDYNGIGYMGAPKYEAYIKNADTRVVAEEDIKPGKTATTKTLEYTTSISNLINNRLKLMFSTDNIQNTIYFENITITYNCHK